MIGELPWATCELFLRSSMAKLVGANVDEVNILNFLTVNLHLLMVNLKFNIIILYLILYSQLKFFIFRFHFTNQLVKDVKF